MLRLWGILKSAAQDFLDDDCLSSGAAIAYYTIFSLPPLLTIAFVAATALGISEDQVRQVIDQEFGLPVAEESGQQSQTMLASSQSESGPSARRSSPADLGLLTKVGGFLMLVFAATGVFGQLQYSLDKAWEVTPDPKQGGLWSFITKRLLSVGLIVVLGLLLMVSLILSTVLDEVLGRLWGTMELGQVLGMVLNELVGFAVATALFAAVFKILPDARVQWNDVWVGAAFTALLFVIGKIAIAAYLDRAQVGSDWGTSAASIIGALVWVYYTSLIVLYGAEFTQAWATSQGHAIEPAQGAMRVSNQAPLAARWE